MLHINRAVPTRHMKSGDLKSRSAIAMRRMITGIASGMALQSALPMVEAQEYELVPPLEGKSGANSGSPLAPNSGFDPPPMGQGLTGQGVAVRARIDVLYYPPGGKEPVLVQRAFETSAATDQSSQYIFDVLNNAALDGVTQALAGGAQSGRVSVTAICYAYGVDDMGSRSVLPMGLFINTTDLKVMADGGTALHTDIKMVPPNAR